MQSRHCRRGVRAGRVTLCEQGSGMAGLSTHVLDTTRGRPAAGVALELYELKSGGRALVAQATTNADGRTDAPLIPAALARVGEFELVFHIGDYFRAQGDALPEPAFLGAVPIRFCVADPQAHYHVPLVATPWSYSTYRGS
jgi:hydroxyisourate hydrolase